MVDIVTRVVGGTAKGSPLTNTELDNNFINLKSAVEAGLTTNETTVTKALLSGLISSINYNADGTVASVIDSSGTTSITYDVQGRPSIIITPLDTLNITYNSNGTVASIS